MVGNISLGKITGTGTEIPKLMPFEIERKLFLRQRLMKPDRRKLERRNATALSSFVLSACSWKWRGPGKRA